MNLEFKSVFLVCIDYGDDVNHVLARSYSMKRAEELADVAKSYWDDKDIYITVEKIAVDDPLKQLQTANINGNKNTTSICICGKNPGGCIGSLSCKCNAISTCKRVTEENPLDFENYSYTKTPILEPTLVEVLHLKRGIVEVIIPEWDPEEVIGLAPNEIAANIKKLLAPGLQLIADVNLDATKVSDLILENLRLAPVPEIEDEEIEEVEEEAIGEETIGEENAEDLNKSEIEEIDDLKDIPD